MSPSSITGWFRRQPSRASAAPELAIGEVTGRLVPCPRCSRPIPRGQVRCPGCGGLQLAGMPGRAAFALIAGGIALGLLGGVVVAGLVAGPGSVPAPIAPGAGAGTPGGTSGAVLSSSRPIVVAPGVSGAILQVAAVNDHLAQASSTLMKVLARRRPSSADIAPLLRTIAADARTGGQAARRLATWDPAAVEARRLLTLYTAIGATATNGLVAPLADHGAYVTAGKRAQKSLKGLKSAGAMATALAALARVELPGASPTP